MKTTTWTVLLADDDALVRDGLRVLIETAPGTEPRFSVVAEASNGAEAVAAWRHHRPDILLMDIRMPEMDGVEATRRILEEDREARILMLTTFRDDEYVRSAIASGARGYLLKSQSADTIIAAMRAACSGASVLTPEVLETLWKPQPQHTEEQGPPPADSEASRWPALSHREREVFRLVAQGLSNREIAATLHLGEGTVRNYVSELLLKLHLRDRTQLAIAYHTGNGK